MLFSLVASGLVGMTDLLLYVQRVYLQTHSYPDELQKMMCSDATSTCKPVQLKLSRLVHLDL